ncbi:MDR family MFS transporter [Cohnella nanjingensis]|uniref:MFS transporter n=1 Tax=Cohnella nanjingensis TaxID=1387779 RepID=A0A7X0VHS3_9BACL|nr:MFS transporter [Cohnella nanjingensis]MBB6674440.1 MFS transporter [Cohnella nanjingensis]
MRSSKLAGLFAKYDGGVWIRVVGAALTTITGFMIRPFLVLYLYDQMEGSVMLPMLIVGLQPLCGIVVSWFGGGWSDRYGRKPLMLAALTIQMLSMIGYVFASDVWQYAAISILNGLGFALFMPAANAQITDMVEEDRRAEVFALMHTAFNVGAAVGPVLGLLMFQWNPAAVFLLSACTFLANALLVAFKLPETAPRRSARGTRAGGGRRPPISWRMHKPLLLMTLYCLPVGLLYAQVETTFPLHLQTRFEDYRTLLASLMTFNGVMVIALQIWIARRSEKMRSYIVLAIAQLLFAAVALGYGYSSWIVALFIAEFVFTIGEMAFGPHTQKVISVLAPAEQRGFYFSVYGASNLLSRGLGPILGGLLLSRTNGEVLFTVLAALILVSGFGLYRVVRGIEAVPRTESERSTLSA